MNETEIKKTKLILLWIITGFLQGCVSKPSLIPTPNLMLHPSTYPASEVQKHLQSNKVDVIYLTDRVAEVSNRHTLAYSAERSPALAYGNATVHIGNNITWDELVKSSETKSRPKKLFYGLSSVNKLGQFPDTPYPFRMTNGLPAVNPAILAKVELSRLELKNHIISRLAKSEKNEVILFIHGYNNSFEDAQFTMAGLWHFLGRQGVPLTYSWPAAHGGLFGYFIDRESGEYTIYHLKEALRLLFSTKQVEKIHIIAHSLGTDVTTTALRELLIEERAKGKRVREVFKIENLILAAPDLDFGVISQRLMAEQFGAAIGQITIYTTQSDRALGLAQKLMTGVRFGRVEAVNITPDEKRIFANVRNVHIVESNNTSSFIGHSYFQRNPAVSSDLIQVIRTSARPGSDQRPLVHMAGNFWRVPQNYLLKSERE